MHKGCGCSSIFLAAVILVFSFWEVVASKWIIIIAAALILLKGIIYLSKHGCTCRIGKTGEEIFVEKNPKSDLPSKDEVKEVMKGKKKIAVKK